MVLQEITDDDLGNARYASHYVYGLDLISRTDETGAQTYSFTDGLGSTLRTVRGSDGTTASTYRYDVFGELRSPPSGMPKDTMLFTGEQYDAKARGVPPANGLYYLRARYYDPAIGRFLSHDALPLLNRYTYVRNNPANFIDPYGLIDLTPDFVNDAWDCATHPVECGHDAVENPVQAVSTASTLVAYADAITGPFLPWWFEVGSWGLTQVSIVLSDCPIGDKIGLLILNAQGLFVGLIGLPAFIGAGVVGGPVAAGSVAAFTIGGELAFTTAGTAIMASCDDPALAQAASRSPREGSVGKE